MGDVPELPQNSPLEKHRRGLRKLPPDLIGKARDENAAQVTRLGLTFLGTAMFCFLSVLGPDSSLIGGNDKVSVPFAGPVSFSGFMLLGPAVLIILRIFLQIYVEHGERLDRLARTTLSPRAPTLLPRQNSLMRWFSGFIFYLLLPITLCLFARKALVYPLLGFFLFFFAIAAIASHSMLRGPLSWRTRGIRTFGMTVVFVGLIIAIRGDLPSRPFDLDHSNFSGQHLPNVNLSGARLSYVNLHEAVLIYADLSNAEIFRSNLSGADLTGAKLQKARLMEANLRGADLTGAHLQGATWTMQI
jgi:hypothetical protein